jgi:hypothetical protein
MLFLNLDALHPTTNSKETFLEKKKHEWMVEMTATQASGKNKLEKI